MNERENNFKISIGGGIRCSCIGRLFVLALLLLLLLKMEFERLLLEIVQKDGRVFVCLASQLIDAAVGCARLFSMKRCGNTASSGSEIVAVIY